jgi:hypothetical protein
MAYSEMLQLRQMGDPIPWSIIHELMPTQLNHRLKQAISQGEQQQQEMQQKAMQVQGQAAMAKIAVDTTKAQKQVVETEKEKAATISEHVKAAKDLQSMQLEKINTILDRLVQFEEISDRKFRREAIVTR